MYKWTRARIKVLKHLGREIHKVLEVMYPAACYQVIFLGKVKALYQVVSQPRVYRPVVNESCGTAALAVLKSFFYFGNDIRGHITIKVQLGISRHFDDVSEKTIKPKGSEKIGQVMPDDILQQNNIGFTVLRRKYHKTR